MDNLDNNVQSVYVDDPAIYNRKVKVVEVPEKNIGIDVDKNFAENIVNAGLNSTLDVAKLQSFTQLSQRRDTIYQLLDTMSEDPTISAALEIYAEDVTETNDEGRVIWCESENPEIVKFVTFLLDTMNVDKNIYKWVYSLCKYGDLYLRLFTESEMQVESVFSEQEKVRKSNDENIKNKLNEDVKFSFNSPNDH